MGAAAAIQSNPSVIPSHAIRTNPMAPTVHTQKEDPESDVGERVRSHGWLLAGDDGAGYGRSARRARLSSAEFTMTESELNAIAAAAMIGLRKPRAAMGRPTVL